MGSHTVRMRGRALAFVTIATVSIAAVSTAGCSQSTANSGWEVVQLPGFSLELPVGQVNKSTKMKSAGSHHVKVMPGWTASMPEPVRKLVQANESMSEGIVTVHWRAGAMTPDEQKELRTAAVNSTSGALGWRVESLKDEKEQGRWLAVIGDGRQRMAIGGAYCAPGLSIYVNFKLSDTVIVEQEGRRIVRSLVCKLGSEIPKLPVLGVELPKEYGHVADSSQDMYVSTRGAFLTVSPTDSNILASKGAVTILNRLFGTLMGAPDAKLDLRREEIQRSDARPAALFEAQGANGLPEGNAFMIGVVYCEDLDLSFLLAAAGESISKDDIRRITSRANCLGFSHERPRSATQILSEGCEAGEGIACGNLSDLIALGKITDSPQSIETLRARACKLDARTWCTDAAH